MVDEKTVDGDPQKIADKDEEIKKLREKLDKESSRVVNAEKKFSEWSNEIGEVRKQKEELVVALADAKKILADLKVAPTSRGGHKQEEVQVEDSDTVEKSLTEDQRKLGEDRFVALSAEEKVKYDSDQKFRLAFLKRLQDSLPVIPSSPWKTAKSKPKNEQGSGYDDILDRVFNKKKQSSFVPPGSTGGITRMTSGEKQVVEPPDDDRVR